MPMSAFLADALIGLIKLNTPIGALLNAERYLALHHSDPTDSCLIGELVGDNYSRTLISLDIVQLPKGSGLTNNLVIVFPLASGTKVQQITHGSIWDSQTGGNPISYGALTAPANWNSGSSLALGINAYIQLLRDTI